MTSQSYKDLIRNNKKLLQNEHDSDVIIYVDDGKNSKEFYAHSPILIARSPYFETAFSNDVEKDDELTGVEILHIRIAADKFLPKKVSDNIQLFLDQKLEEFVRHDAVSMLQEIFKYNNSICESLRESCLQIICKDPNALFDHSNFTQLDEIILMIVLQQDDLGELSEISILNYLVKWGIARILTTTTQDITELENSDYIKLQKVINDCVPFIRWFQIPISEFRQNLSWIEKILPSKLYLDIVNYHFDNTTPPETFEVLPRNIPSKDSEETRKEAPRKYLYTSEIAIDKLNGVEILQLLVAADELQLQNIVDNFQPLMNQKLEEIMRDDIVFIFYTIFKHNNRIYESLRDRFLYCICMNPRLLFDDPKFTQLDKYLLKITLQRDDLGNISEDDIWNYLVIWGISQASDILQSKNIYEWKEDDYLTFKMIIYELIPLIHWFQISSTTFKQNLLFFEKILDNELYHDIIRYHLNSVIPNKTFRTFPSRYTPSNNIAFVNPQCFNIIANWISMCTVEKTPEIKRKRQSFMDKILNLHDKSSNTFYDLSRSNLARVKKDSYAVEYSPLNGPIFGHSDYKEGYDMCIYNNILAFGRRSCYPDSKNFSKASHFEIEDYEVWQ
ncbi:15167_t:CDS:2, partial [Dentiscutata erythropus]